MNIAELKIFSNEGQLLRPTLDLRKDSTPEATGATGGPRGAHRSIKETEEPTVAGAPMFFF